MFGIRQRITKIRQHQRLSNNDVLIASFPKVGSTFTRFVFANLIHLYYKKEMVDFHNISLVLPELYKQNFYNKWSYDSFPRIIKTHDIYQSPYNRVKDILYVIRDPRDTMLSYFSYANAKKNIQAPSEFEQFVKDRKLGIPALNKHLESYSGYYTTVFKYENLMLEPLECFNNYLNVHLKLNLDHEMISKAIELSSPDKMRKVENTLGRPTNDNYSDDFRFIRNAKVSQWKSEMTDNMSDMIMSLASPRFQELGYQ